MHTYFSHALPTYSKNEKAAKDFLRWVHSKDVYEKWFVSQKGFATPPTAGLGEAQGVGRGSGHDPLQGGGPPRSHAGLCRARRMRKAAEVLSKYIITDMYAKAVQGMPAEEAVKWAEGELKKVYV